MDASPSTNPTTPGPILTADSDNLAQAFRKLHVQYSHAAAGRLSDLLRTQGVQDAAGFASVRKVAADCQVCKQNGPAPTHAAVTIPRATNFHDVVAVDLFFIPGTPPIPMLHAIDHFSRFSKCILLTTKTGAAACTAFLTWVVTFGAPRRLSHDEGGEVDNGLWRLLCERFGIHIEATAAPAPWSNGLCERR